jgi:uncharacterized protein (DUF433 family)
MSEDGRSLRRVWLATAAGVCGAVGKSVLSAGESVELGWRIRVALKSLDQHIEVTPGVAGAKPRIAGHRITVQNIVIWHERLGRSADEIAADYDLTLADVYAALAYYFDHRDEIDRTIQEGEAFVEALRQSTPSKLEQKLREKQPRGPEDQVLR